MADFILRAAAFYIGCGVFFGVLFVTLGISRVDRAASGSPWLFRLLILPACAALWPLMLLKWIHAARSARDGEHSP